MTTVLPSINHYFMFITFNHHSGLTHISGKKSILVLKILVSNDNPLCTSLCVNTHIPDNDFILPVMRRIVSLFWSTFIANRTCNTTVTGSCRIRYYQIQSDPVIFPVIGPSVLSAANQNAWVMTQQANSRPSDCIAAHYKIVPIKIADKLAIKIAASEIWCLYNSQNKIDTHYFLSHIIILCNL